MSSCAILSSTELNALVGDIMGPFGVGEEGVNSLSSTSNNTTSAAISNYCGYTFKVGDLIFHCQDCALDSTCVLCHHCFNPLDHEGHAIKYYPSVDMGKGVSSGCCDCGELESWKCSFNCPLGHGAVYAGSQAAASDGAAKSEEVELVNDIAVFISNSLLEIHKEVLDRLCIKESSVDVEVVRSLNVVANEDIFDEDAIDELGNVDTDEQDDGEEDLGEEEMDDEFVFEDAGSDSGEDDIPQPQRGKMDFLPEPQEHPATAVLVLFNDEVHSYDDVIRALCSINSGLSKEDAHSIADLVDKNGFAIIEHSLSSLTEAIGRMRRVHTLDCRSMSLKCANNLLLVTELFIRIAALPPSEKKITLVELLFSPFFTPIPRLYKPHDEVFQNSSFYGSLADIMVHWDNYYWKKLRQLTTTILTSALSSAPLKLQIANALINPANIHSLILEIGGIKAAGTREFPLTIFNFSVQIFTVQTVASQITPTSISSLLNEMKIILLELQKDDCTPFKFARMRSSFTYLEQILTYIYSHNPIASPEIGKSLISLLTTFQNSFPIKKKIGDHLLFDDQLWPYKFTLGTYLLYFIMSFIKHYPQPLLLLFEIEEIPSPLDKEIFSFHQPILWLFGAVIEGRTEEEISLIENDLRRISLSLKDLLCDFLTKLTSLIEGDWVRNGSEIPSSIRGLYSHDFLRFILVTLKLVLRYHAIPITPPLLGWVNSALFGVCLGGGEQKEKMIQFEVLNILLKRKSPSPLQAIMDSLPFYMKSFMEDPEMKKVFLAALAAISIKKSSTGNSSGRSTLQEVITTDDYLFEAKEEAVKSLFSPHSLFKVSSSEKKSIITYCKERFAIRGDQENRSQVCGNLVTNLPCLSSYLTLMLSSSFDKIELLLNLMDNGYDISSHLPIAILTEKEELPPSLKEYLSIKPISTAKREIDSKITDKRALILKKIKEDQEQFMKLNPVTKSPSTEEQTGMREELPLLESGFCIICKELVDGQKEEEEFGVLAQENEMNIIGHSVGITSCFHLVHKTCYPGDHSPIGTGSPECPLCKAPYSKFILVPDGSVEVRNDRNENDNDEEEEKESATSLKDVQNVLQFKASPLQSYFITAALQLVAMDVGDFKGEKEIENITRIVRIVKRNIMKSFLGTLSLGNDPMLNMVIYLKNAHRSGGSLAQSDEEVIETFIEWEGVNGDHYRAILRKMLQLWYDGGNGFSNAYNGSSGCNVSHCSATVSTAQRDLLNQIQKRHKKLPPWSFLVPQKPAQVDYSDFYMKSRELLFTNSSLPTGEEEEFDNLICFFCGEPSTISSQYFKQSNAMIHCRSKNHRPILNSSTSRMVNHPPNECLHKECGIYYYVSKCAMLLLLPMKTFISSQLIPAPFVSENGETDLCFSGSGGRLSFSADRFNSIRRLWISSNIYRLVHQLTMEDLNNRVMM